MPKKKVIDNISIENARIGYRNFSGKETTYNARGKRNFCVFLDEETAVKLEKDGWNIKRRIPRQEGEEVIPFLQVTVSFDHIPPNIILVTKKGRRELSSKTVNMLDWAEIENVDLVIRPYNWEVSGKGGVKAYVRNMYVTIVEDEFAAKYADMPMANNQDYED